MEAPPRYNQDDAADFDALLQDISAVKLEATGLTPLTAGAGPMHAAPGGVDGATLESSQRRYELCADYDGEIDGNLRKMEAEDAGERPSPDYLRKVQAGLMDPWTRALLVEWMDRFTRCYGLADGTLHRAVAYVDRFLSAVPLAITGRQLRLLGSVAAFAAAKYEDQSTTRKLSPGAIALHGGFTRGEVLRQEGEMIAVLGYRLGGPTAHTFAEHFTRHCGREGGVDALVRSLAHHLADLALLEYRNLQLLPSVVAASALFVARCAVNRMCGLPWDAGVKEMAACTRYAPMDLARCIGAMYDMHEVQVWPGYVQMRLNYWMGYSLPTRPEIIQYIFLAD